MTGSGAGTIRLEVFALPSETLVTLVPSIQQQPASVTVAPGTSAIYTVTASSPSPLGYQWRKDGVTLSGATGATLTLSNVQAADAGTPQIHH